MAQVPNQVYPVTAGEFDAFYIRSPNISGSSIQGTNITGSNIFASTVILTGFTAENAIAQYQPVTTATVPLGAQVVSGSSARVGGPILGIALNSSSAGGTVNILTKGIIPTFASGSITVGAPLLISTSGSSTTSGSYWCWAVETYSQVGVVAYWAGAASGSAKIIIGYALTAGSASSGSSGTYSASGWGNTLMYVDV